MSAPSIRSAAPPTRRSPNGRAPITGPKAWAGGRTRARTASRYTGSTACSTCRWRRRTSCSPAYRKPSATWLHWHPIPSLPQRCEPPSRPSMRPSTHSPTTAASPRRFTRPSHPYAGRGQALMPYRQSCATNLRTAWPSRNASSVTPVSAPACWSAHSPSRPMKWSPARPRARPWPFTMAGRSPYSRSPWPSTPPTVGRLRAIRQARQCFPAGRAWPRPSTSRQIPRRPCFIRTGLAAIPRPAIRSLAASAMLPTTSASRRPCRPKTCWPCCRRCPWRRRRTA